MKKDTSQIVGQVFETTDYNIFKKLKGNRGCTEARKRAVLKSIQSIGQLVPAEVDEHMAIIDGQARFEACKELGIPFKYIVVSGKGIEAARSANACMKPWQAGNYLESFAECGNHAYVLLQKACKETGLSASNVLAATTHNGDGARMALKEGTLKFDENDLACAIVINQKCNDIRNALGLKAKPTNTFVHAVQIIVGHENYDHEHMLQNCKRLKTEYVFTGGIATMLKTFSTVYNNRLQKADKIYFEDYMRNKGANVINYGADWFKTTEVQTLGKETKNGKN